MKKLTIAVLVAAGLSVTPMANSHLDSDTFHVAYRQSVFAILGANLGPMGSMVKGEMPWDDKAFGQFAEDLHHATQLNIMRGFKDGNEPGKTRAKSALFDNKEDVAEKWGDLRRESAELARLAATADRGVIVEQFKKTGGTCKACHDEYKEKNYIN